MLYPPTREFEMYMFQQKNREQSTHYINIFVIRKVHKITIVLG